MNGSVYPGNTREYTALRLNNPLCVSDFNQDLHKTTICMYLPNVAFHEDPKSGSQLVKYQRTDGQQLQCVLHRDSNAPKNSVGPTRQKA